MTFCCVRNVRKYTITTLKGVDQAARKLFWIRFGNMARWSLTKLFSQTRIVCHVIGEMMSCDASPETQLWERRGCHYHVYYKKNDSLRNSELSKLQQFNLTFHTLPGLMGLGLPAGSYSEANFSKKIGQVFKIFMLFFLIAYRESSLLCSFYKIASAQKTDYDFNHFESLLEEPMYPFHLFIISTSCSPDCFLF